MKTINAHQEMDKMKDLSENENFKYDDMVDITTRSTTLRIAVAQAIVQVSTPDTIAAIKNNEVPKGDVFAMSRVAGLLGVKRTSEIVPDCYPVPIQYAEVEFDVQGLEIAITFTVKTIYKTGVEVEAMHGASVVALTMYEMLKPIDEAVEIQKIKIHTKKGGMSDFTDRFRKDLKAAVVVCSDSISSGKKEDRAGKAVIQKLKSCGVEILDYIIIPDEKDLIQERTLEYEQLGADLILFTGGTGLSERDITPEALEPLLDRRIPGIEEAIRNYGQNRTPFSMLSRSIAGTYKNALVLGLPGSTNGAKESMEAVFPSVLHIFRILKGARHD